MSLDLDRPIVFLASYPRSGNTFLRGLLANAASRLDRPLSVQEIAFFGAGEKNETLWRASAGAPAETRTLEQEWRARATYMSLVRASPGEGPVMFKTHSHAGVAFDLTAFDIQSRDRIVYIVRHPFDVLLSCAAFYGLDLTAMASRLTLSGAFNDEGGVGPYETTGSWVENVAGWLTETRCPLLLLRYQDLLADPAGQLARVSSFVGIAATPERLSIAASFASFQTMKSSHALSGFDQGPRRGPKAQFFREGRPDQWKTALPRSLQQKLLPQIGDLMDVLGFERASEPS